MEDQFDEWAKSSGHPCLRQHADRLRELGASWDSFKRRGRDVDSIVDDLVRGGIPLLAARDIVGLASEAVGRSTAPLAVFWDLENMPLPAASRGRDVVARLKQILSAHGSLVQFRAYASIGLNNVQEQKRSDLQLSGVHLVDCPHLGRKEVADKMIIVDAMKFAFENENPDGATLCFVSGDVDYAYLLAVLRERPRVRTIVISKGTLQSMLHVNCDIKMRWETDILALRPSRPGLLQLSNQSNPSTPVRRNVATSPPPQSLPPSRMSTAVDPTERPSIEQPPQTPRRDVGQDESGDAATALTPSQRLGFICTADDDDSASSFEALTIDEEWTDDAELLRRTLPTVALNTGLPSGPAPRTEVDKALRYANPARFPNRGAVREFLELSIREGVVVESIEGDHRVLSLPADDDDDDDGAGGASRPSISLCERQPPDDMIDSMTKRALDMSAKSPFIIFVKWKARPSSHPGGPAPFPSFKTYVQTTRRYIILMFRTLTDAQRTAAEHTWLRSGVLVDWRRVEPLRKERVRCAACRKSSAKADMLLDPKVDSLYCRRCFVASIPQAGAVGGMTTHSARRVVQLLEMMAENDDLYVHRDAVRAFLKQRWPNDCGSAKQTNIWISDAIDAEAVFYFKIPGEGTSCLCLSSLADEALIETSSSELVDTSEVEDYIVNMLRERGGAMKRTEVIANMKDEFRSMQTGPMRNKVFANAEENGRFFVSRGAFLQTVGVTSARANAALNEFSTALGAPVEQPPVPEDAEGEEESELTEQRDQQLDTPEAAAAADTGNALRTEQSLAESSVSDWEGQTATDEGANVTTSIASDSNAATSEETLQADEQLNSASQAPGADTASESATYDDIWDTPTWNEDAGRMHSSAKW